MILLYWQAVHIKLPALLGIEYSQLRNLRTCELADNSNPVTSSRLVKKKAFHTNICVHLRQMKDLL